MARETYGRCYEFNNMDLMSYQDLDNPGTSSPGFRKVEDPTSLGNEHEGCEFFYQKSDKDLASGY
jgi:hypothetical protein